jgi:cytochrome c2
MRNNTEKIGRYLQNEMSADEINAFEKQLAGDKDLQQELAIQKQILAAVEKAGLKNSFGKAVRTKFISRMLIRWGIVLIVVSGLAYYAFKTNIFSHSESGGEGINVVSGTEGFVIDNSADTIIETDEGVVFGIPANAFNSENKKIRLEIKTAISPDKIMLQGLSTTSNGQLLQTAGMFYLNGYDGNKPVSLVKKIDVSVPTEKVIPAMQLFDGVQDSSGRINWVNPKPIEKRLRTYDVTSLDFYPPYYLPVLKALEKDDTNKRYTDSLYYSFSGYPEMNPAIDEQLQGGKIFYQKCASCHIMGKDLTGPNLQGVLSRWPSKQVLKEWILDWKVATKKYPDVADKANWSPSDMQVFKGNLNDAELEALINWINEWQPQSQAPETTINSFKVTKDSAGIIVLNKPKEEGERDYATQRRRNDTLRYDTEASREIDPSRIRAIWDKKFNNTIIATKEFEERLQYMHSICRPLFLVYLENLNKPMYEIDQFIAANVSEMADVHHKFLEFAARKDGGVMLKEGIQQELSNYFEKKLKAYRDASAKTLAKHEQELARLAGIADNKRRTKETKDFLRKDKNFQEEFCANLTDAYRQIGVKRTCNDTIIPPPPPTNYYNIEINTVGWKNLDMYVYDATEARESMTYTDPATGKKAAVTYKEVSIIIEDKQQFDRVLVYLLPSELASFQRIDENGNVFKEKLNMLFKYDAVAIGFKGEQAYFYKQTNLQPGQYSFRLSATTDKELKQQLKTGSKERSEEMLNEYEYQLFEQQEIRREIQLRKELDFRNQVMNAIWPCGEGRFSVGSLTAADSTSKVQIEGITQ